MYIIHLGIDPLGVVTLKFVIAFESGKLEPRLLELQDLEGLATAGAHARPPISEPRYEA